MQDWAQRWDERHRRAAGDRDEPAEWLVLHEDLLQRQPRGRALDVACGRGRNALFLAALGYEVDAVDLSGVAVDIVRRRSAAAGAAIDAVRADVRATPSPRPPYQVVVDIDFLERSALAQLAAALAPGGLLLMETWTIDHPTMNRAFTLAPNELLRAFGDLRVLHYRDSGARAGIVARRS